MSATILRLPNPHAHKFARCVRDLDPVLVRLSRKHGGYVLMGALVSMLGHSLSLMDKGYARHVIEIIEQKAQLTRPAPPPRHWWQRHSARSEAEKLHGL